MFTERTPAVYGPFKGRYRFARVMAEDPIREYQREGYSMFMDMIARIKMDTLEKLSLVRIQREEEVEEIRQKQKQDYILSRGEDVPIGKTVKRNHNKVGRNDPCPCGSGKKYKKCCGA